MTLATLETLLEEAAAGRRLSAEEAVQLYESTPLLRLGQAAQAARFRLHPEHRVTYLVDRKGRRPPKFRRPKVGENGGREAGGKADKARPEGERD